MTTRRQFLTASAALPVLYNFQSTMLGADEVTKPTTERQPSTQVILSFATEVADEPKDFDHIKALAEMRIKTSCVPFCLSPFGFSIRAASAMKQSILTACVCLCILAVEVSADDKSAALPDLALQSPRVLTDLGPDHVKSSRGAQGVPAIERSAHGRLWAAWYAGRSQRGVESSSSYCVLATSGDDGQSWSEKLVIQPRRFVHTYDPCLWIDPQRRLWFFWAQSAGVQDGRMGVWAIVTNDADSETPEWSQPRRIANGVMLNKPTELKNGDWLLPVGLWRDNTNVPNVKFDAEELEPYTIEILTHDLGDERGSNVYRSTDQGKSFQRIGQVGIPRHTSR